MDPLSPPSALRPRNRSAIGLADLFPGAGREQVRVHREERQVWIRRPAAYDRGIRLSGGVSPQQWKYCRQAQTKKDQKCESEPHKGNPMPILVVPQKP